MARSDDDEIRGPARSTVPLIKTMGHPASGGHYSPLSAANRAFWDVIQDDDGEQTDMAYEFQEYPKFIDLGDGKGVIVQDADEEATARGGDKIIREDEERVRLLKVAEVKGVTVDKRWGLPKIAQAITEAGFDATLNPFE